MLGYDQVPQQYFKQLNIQTEIEYHFDKDKFPELADTGYEPSLVVAQVGMGKSGPNRVEPVSTVEPPSNPEDQRTVNYTAFNPVTSSHYVQNAEKPPYPQNQKNPQQQPVLHRCPSMNNRLPDQTVLRQLEHFATFSKNTCSDQLLNGYTNSNSSHTTQRRLSYGLNQRTESTGNAMAQNRTQVDDAQNSRMTYPNKLNRSHQLSSDLLPSTVLSCLDPFDDSMSRTRTDGTLSGVSTPVSTTTEYSGNSTTSYYQRHNTSHPHTQAGSVPDNSITSQSRRLVPSPQDVIQTSNLSNFDSSTRPSNSLLNNSQSVHPTDGFPKALFARPAQHLFRPDRLTAPATNVRKHLQFSYPQPDTVNPRVLAARRQHLSRKRSADMMHDFLAPNSKRPRRDHIEIYGVESGTPLLESHPKPVETVTVENPVFDNFDEYSCPARPKSDVPSTTQRRHTGTIHYYGATQSNANPLAKRFNPNFLQHSSTTTNIVNHPGPGMNRSLTSQVFNNPTTSSSYSQANNSTGQSPPFSEGLTNCSSENIPLNVCVTKDTFLDILYAN